MYRVVVSYSVESSKREEFVGAALRDRERSLENERGTLEFRLIPSTEDETTFFIDEGYENEEALAAHLEGPYAKEFFLAIAEYAQGPTFIIKGYEVEAEASS